jgi:hypothetical protein
MLLLWVAPAFAATLDVCATCPYTTVGEAALHAGWGDTIRVAAGEYDEDGIEIADDLEIVGAGSDVTVLRSSSASDYIIRALVMPDMGDRKLAVSGISFEGPAEGAIRLTNYDAVLSDIRADGFSGTAISSGSSLEATLTCTGCRFSDNASAISVGSNGHVRLSVSGCSFSGHTGHAISASAASVRVSGSVFVGTQDRAVAASMSDVVLSGNTFHDNPGGAVDASWSDSLSLTRNVFCGNEASSGGAVRMYAAHGDLDASNNVFVGNSAASAGGDIYVAAHEYAATLVNNTFVGGRARSGGSVWFDGQELTFRNNIVAFTSEYGLQGEPEIATITYNDFWSVSPDAVSGTMPVPDATNLAVDPLFLSYSAGGCSGLDLGLQLGSALIDAGDPSTKDPDGSIADTGATGGRGAAQGTYPWYRDDDGDGFGIAEDTSYGLVQPSGYAPYAGDCDDLDPDAYPTHSEVCDGLDQDCDGLADEGLVATWRPDADGDGSQGLDWVISCDRPAGWWETDGGPYDCDDADPHAFPGAQEVPYDGIDQNCDGRTGGVEPAPPGRCDGCDHTGSTRTALAIGAALTVVLRRQRSPRCGLRAAR